jgi:hypothetical protein
VLQALVDLGHAVVVARIEQAQRDGTPLLLALRPPPPPPPPVSDAFLPSVLQAVEVLAARADDYDALLGGAL